MYSTEKVLRQDGTEEVPLAILKRLASMNETKI